MNSAQCSLSRVVATGFVVCLVFSVCLFWGDAGLRRIGKAELIRDGGMNLHLVLDLGSDIPSDPNLEARPPRVFCEFASHRSAESDVFIDTLLEVPHWIAGYELSHWPGRLSHELANSEVCPAWYDPQGLIMVKQDSGKADGAPPKTRYVGPKGFSDRPDRALERFSRPQLCAREDPSTIFIYDQDLKAFFKIDFDREKVTSKSWADKAIIDTGRKYLTKFPILLQIHAHEASRLETDQEMETRLGKYKKDSPAAENPEDQSMVLYGSDDPLMSDPRIAIYMESMEPVAPSRKRIPLGPSLERLLPNSGPWAMDDQGTIYLIDRDTLSLSPAKGCLPDCGQEKTHDPSRLLTYTVLPLFVDGKYFGLVATSLSRDSSQAVMVLLDQQGREIGRSVSRLDPLSYRYGQVTSYARNVLNFAQPLAFSTASSLWGPRTEAVSGYRNLFVLPLSMPARIAADPALKAGDRIGTVIMWNVFTWCVGLLLAIAVIRDLKQRGMSKKAQHGWLFACMGFGWIAVFTYLLTRPRLQFVTCTGCGRTRRIDQSHCLHCEADWTMSALQAPAWRVVD